MVVMAVVMVAYTCFYACVFGLWAWADAWNSFSSELR